MLLSVAQNTILLLLLEASIRYLMGTKEHQCNARKSLFIYASDVYSPTLCIYYRAGKQDINSQFYAKYFSAFYFSLYYLKSRSYTWRQLFNLSSKSTTSLTRDLPKKEIGIFSIGLLIDKIRFGLTLFAHFAKLGYIKRNDCAMSP